MTLPATRTLQFSPWLSVWLRPGETIERILAGNPRRHVLLLASLGTISSIIVQLIDSGYATELPDVRIIGVVALAGAAIGVAALYIAGLLFRWSGWMLGGRRSAAELRAVLAWGMSPMIAGLAFCLIALIGLRLSVGAGAPEPVSRAVTIALRVITDGLGVWALIVTMLMLARVQGFGFWRTMVSFALGWLLLSLLVLLPLLMRTFFFQPFSIPSTAMIPTLLVGDRLLVSKFSYGYSHYSLPFSPQLFSGRVFESEPQRGDVVVFRLPKNDSIDYIKRVVGLPGDRIQMIDGLFHINGEPVKRELIEDCLGSEVLPHPIRVKCWRETLPNGVSYATLKLVENGVYDNTPVFWVPSGHYFMMGDNRDNSTDSRVLSEVGYIPFVNIIGRAEIIFLSIEQVSRTGQPALRFERIGMPVQ